MGGRIDDLRMQLAPGTGVSAGAIGRIQMRIRALMVGRTQMAFVDQRRGDQEWSARGVPNIAGALRDLEMSATVKSRRFDARPAGVDTGQLRASIQGVWTEKWIFEYGSRLEYARRFQRGEPHFIEITPIMKTNLSMWLRRGGAGGGSQWKKNFGFLLKKDRLEIKPAPRPFVMFTDADRQAVLQIVREELLKR